MKVSHIHRHPAAFPDEQAELIADTTNSDTDSSAEPSWKKHLQKEGDGSERRPEANLRNAISALEHSPDWQGVLHFNESSLDTVAKALPPWDIAQTRILPFIWDDTDDLMTAAWLQKQNINVSSNIASQAVQAVARKSPYHPIREYLLGLEWDLQPRIKTWLTTYLGVDATDYTNAVGSRFLISGVARVMKPGCKVDTCLVLEGGQGKFKSTALETLASKPWFTDDMPELGNKDAALQLRGVWLIELAELHVLERTTLARIKSFLSRSKDRFRPPYGRRSINVDRECIFAGSVNHGVYFDDETGPRRFWPVKTGKIDIDRLARDRDQLWAEAFAYCDADSPWWLPPHLEALAAEEQKSRYRTDVWQDSIADFVAGQATVSAAEVLRSLGKAIGDWNRSDEMRVAKCLTYLGWKRSKVHIDGKQLWRYKRV